MREPVPEPELTTDDELAIYCEATFKTDGKFRARAAHLARQLREAREALRLNEGTIRYVFEVLAGHDDTKGWVPNSRCWRLGEEARAAASRCLPEHQATPPDVPG